MIDWDLNMPLEIVDQKHHKSVCCCPAQKGIFCLFILEIFMSLQKEPPQVFYKKGVLKNFAKFTGKNLCESLFFDKVAGLESETLLKKRL